MVLLIPALGAIRGWSLRNRVSPPGVMPIGGRPQTCSDRRPQRDAAKQCRLIRPRLPRSETWTGASAGNSNGVRAGRQVNRGTRWATDFSTRKEADGINPAKVRGEGKKERREEVCGRREEEASVGGERRRQANRKTVERSRGVGARMRQSFVSCEYDLGRGVNSFPGSSLIYSLPGLMPRTRRGGAARGRLLSGATVTASLPGMAQARPGSRTPAVEIRVRSGIPRIIGLPCGTREVTDT